MNQPSAMMQLRLIDDVRPLSGADYEEVIRRYGEECISIPGVCAIYQFGNVAAPGLSDVDLVVVLDDDARLDNPALARVSILHERWRREPLVRACFTHDVYLCSRSSFLQVEYLMPGNSWTLRAGEPAHPAAPRIEEREIVELVHGLDFCIGRLEELAQLDDGARRSTRELVPRLWSLTHTHRILASIGVDLEPSWEDVIHALEAMRAGSLTELKSQVVSQLVEPVLTHFALAVDHLAAMLGVRAGLDVNEPRRECRLALFPRRTLYVYSAAVDHDCRACQTTATSLRRSFQLGRRTVHAGWARVALPGIVLAHHLTYFAQDSTYDDVATRIARHGRAGVGASGGDVYRRVISKRWELTRSTDLPPLVGGHRLSSFRIPGLPVPPVSSPSANGTWRFRVVRSWLDWRLLPVGTVQVKFRMTPNGALRST